MKTEKLIAHVEKIAAENKITVRRELRKGAGIGAKAYAESRVVVTWGINGQHDYFTALHEIGHILVKQHDDADLIREEAEAWRWAITNSIVEPNEKTKQFIGKCLYSYTKKPKPDQKVPAEDHFIWPMVEWRHIGEVKRVLRRTLP